MHAQRLYISFGFEDNLIKHADASLQVIVLFTTVS